MKLWKNPRSVFCGVSVENAGCENTFSGHSFFCDVAGGPPDRAQQPIVSRWHEEIPRTLKSVMDNIDIKILKFIQEGFPLVSRPYAAVGEEVGCSEQETFRRVISMKKAGVIRRIGANFDSRKLGYVSTLVGMRVPEKDLERVAALVNCYPQVTHNYQREDTFNLWFTLVAQSRKELEQIVEEIRMAAPEAELLDLPAKRVFKLRVRFDPSAE